MTLLQEAEKLLSAMSRAEKAQLLQWVVQDLGDAFPGIESVLASAVATRVSSARGSRSGSWSNTDA